MSLVLSPDGIPVETSGQPKAVENFAIWTPSIRKETLDQMFRRTIEHPIILPFMHRTGQPRYPVPMGVVTQRPQDLEPIRGSDTDSLAFIA